MHLDDLRKEHKLSDDKNPSKMLKKDILRENKKLQKARALKSQSYGPDIPVATAPFLLSAVCLVGALGVWVNSDENK